MNELLRDLNKDQRKVVEATHGPVLVLAGAGSGKTRALTYRIAYLVQEGIAKDTEILAVTFTNKAAGEMKERVSELLGTAHATPNDISTFHSLGVRILREQAAFLPRSRGFIICDAVDSEKLVRQAMDDTKTSKKEFNAKKLKHKISSSKNSLVTPADALHEAKSHSDEVFARIYNRYEKLLSANDAYDFDDLLLATFRLVQTNKEVREYYQKRWKFISVDEYQDTNVLQDNLLKLFIGDGNNICVVGDDYQAIYSWRGAKVDHILGFEQRWEGCKTIYLTQNYRSTQSILDASNEVIAENKEQKHKSLWTDKNKGDAVTVIGLPSGKSEASFVRGAIEEHVSDGGKRSDCVILYRTNAQSRVLEEEFLTHGIPYTIVGGFRFYERKEIKDAMALLQLWANPSANLSLRRIADALWSGIGVKTVANWEARALEEKVSVRDIVFVESQNRQVLKKVANMYAKSVDIEYSTVSELLSHLIEESGYAKWLKSQADGEERWENIVELLNVTEPYEDVDTFLEEVALLTDIDKMDAEQDRVTCMTLHAAKGLEFKVVFMVGLEEGLLPHANSFGAAADMEEERRLMYVGMTRAKQRLIMSHALTRYTHGEVTRQMPSRFLNSLPDSVENIAAEEPEDFSTDNFGIFDDDMDLDPIVISVEEGDFVQHKQFGKGVVIGIKGNVITCVFESVGVKSISAESVKAAQVG